MENTEDSERAGLNQNRDTSCTGIRLGKKLKKQLQKLAKKEDRSVSSIIRTLIIEALAARDK